jgi:hypothetical protein
MSFLDRIFSQKRKRRKLFGVLTYLAISGGAIDVKVEDAGISVAHAFVHSTGMVTESERLSHSAGMVTEDVAS